jgi:mono/diheme cytochrome c family protein
LAFALASCAERDELAAAVDFPAGAAGKADVFGRGLSGVAAPYEPNPELEDPVFAEALRKDMALRREIGWNTAFKILQPVPLFGLVEVIDGQAEVSWPENNVPQVPRFQTWYGVDDLKRTFRHLYETLSDAERAERVPIADESIAEALAWNAHAVERSDRWPLERYLRHIGKLAECPDGLSEVECEELRKQNLGGATSGTSRMLYSPGTITHLLSNYASIERCLDRLDRLAMGEEPDDEDNFTACFASEFPVDSVLVKAHWVRADFDRDLAAFDTDAAALQKRLAGTADWGDQGDRKVDPDADEIYTIRLRDGSLYRLAGLHIMTKELRHWQWVTLWWSDTPQSDFGADRPATFEKLAGVWSRYKMCAVSWFDEQDPQLSQRFAELPSLHDALLATSSPQQPSWCSNPYLEHGRNNAATNCIGCHQHGGATVAFDVDGDEVLDPLDLEQVIQSETLYPNQGRSQLREMFPADYTYSFNRVDDLSRIIKEEMDAVDRIDAELAPRIDGILQLSADPDAGAVAFAGGPCEGCHGAGGQGSAFAPSLFDRVPERDDRSLLRTLITGRGGMPALGAQKSDQELADLVAFLRAQFKLVSAP